MYLPFISQAPELWYLVKYFAFVISEGDWANDWLTYLPGDIAEAAQTIGQWMAQ